MLRRSELAGHRGAYLKTKLHKVSARKRGLFGPQLHLYVPSSCAKHHLSRSRWFKRVVERHRTPNRCRFTRLKDDNSSTSHSFTENSARTLPVSEGKSKPRVNKASKQMFQTLKLLSQLPLAVRQLTIAKLPDL